jgi:Rha family phage regulatory protein
VSSIPQNVSIETGAEAGMRAVQPMLRVIDGKLVADSRDVAGDFGRRHGDLLRAIDEYLHDAKIRHEVLPWLIERQEPHPTVRGRCDRYFLLTREGFSVVVNGLTGEKARHHRIRYVRAFEQMEATLRGLLAGAPPEAPPVSEGLAARASADNAKARLLEATTRIYADVVGAFPGLGAASRQELAARVYNPVLGEGAISLPRVGPTETTTEIAEEFGIAPNTLGGWVGHLKTPEHGELRLTKARHSNKQVDQWFWNAAGAAAVRALLRQRLNGAGGAA